MQSSEIDTYLRVLSEFKGAVMKIRDLAATVKLGATVLEKWRLAYIESDKIILSHTFLEDRESDIVLNLCEWPDAKEIAAAHLAWSDATIAVMNAYGHVSREDRRNIPRFVEVEEELLRGS